jgi:hypothetical protein
MLALDLEALRSLRGRGDRSARLFRATGARARGVAGRQGGHRSAAPAPALPVRRKRPAPVSEGQGQSVRPNGAATLPTCAAPGCSRPFEPRPRKVYCSDECRDRVNRARRHERATARVAKPEPLPADVEPDDSAPHAEQPWQADSKHSDPLSLRPPPLPWEPDPR